MANNYKRWLCEESLKTPLLATHFNIFWIYKQAFTHYCHLHEPSLTRPTNFNLLRQNIVFWYLERIPVSFSWLFHYFSFFLLLLFYVIINFCKNYFIIFILLLLFFFHENCFDFFMFRNVPGCSGMFHVPCFIDAPYFTNLRMDSLWIH